MVDMTSKKAFAVFSVMLMAALSMAAVIPMVSSEDSYAVTVGGTDYGTSSSPVSGTLNGHFGMMYDNNLTDIYVMVGTTITFTYVNEEIFFMGATTITSSNAHGLSLTGSCEYSGITIRTLTGTASSPGTVAVTVYLDDDSTQVYRTFTVHIYGDLAVSFNVNGGSGVIPTQSVTTSSSSYTFTIPSTVPTKIGYSFLGWSTSSTATTASYQPGSTITVSANTTLYAVWKLAIIVDDMTVKAGDNISITPVTSGTVTVSGVSWLSVNGNLVYGTAPTTPGEYTVTVTSGSSSASFTITVVSRLAFTSTPTNGALIFVA